MLTDKEVARYHRRNILRALLAAFIISWCLILIINVVYTFIEYKEYEAKRGRIISGSR